MLRDKAVDLLMNRLGQRRSATTKDQIIGEMAFVQETLLEGNATQFWFTVKDSSGLATIVDTEAVALPSDFIQEYEEGALYITKTDGALAEIGKEDWDVIAIHSQLLGTGLPTHYALEVDNILLKKTPDLVYLLQMKYHATQTSLAGVYGDSANVENNWLKYASDWFIAEVGMILAGQYLQSDKMVQMFQGQSQKALDRLIKKNTSIAEGNRIRNMDA